MIPDISGAIAPPVGLNKLIVTIIMLLVVATPLAAAALIVLAVSVLVTPGPWMAYVLFGGLVLGVGAWRQIR